MRTITQITLALSFFILSSSFGIAQKWGKKIEGNGNITTKTVTTGDYDSVNVVGSMDVVLERGTEGTITVTTDDNIHDYISIESNGGKLKIKIVDQISIKTKKGIHITVPFESVSDVSLVGSGDVTGRDTIKSDSFEASVTGSGDMVLNVEAMTIDAKVTGSGDMELEGKAQDLEIKVSGSGDFKGRSLRSENAQAYVSGSGDIEVYAKTSLKARVNGSGDIRYDGNPATRDTKVMGSGSIKTN